MGEGSAGISTSGGEGEAGGHRVKALSLHLPWSHLVAIGRKRYETRGWQTSYRGLIAIHTTRTTLHQPSATMRPLAEWAPLYEFTPGHIVALAWLKECLPADEAATLLTAMKDNAHLPVKVRLAAADELTFGDFSDGRFAWDLVNVWRLPTPVYQRGLQQIWRVSEPVADAICKQYQKAAGVRMCRDCGCTDLDCRQCIESSGEPCQWVGPFLCSRCQAEASGQRSEVRSQGRWLQTEEVAS
jgi:activating signal cointegrator 1